MKKLRYIAWFILLISLAASIITTLILLQQRDTFKKTLEDAVTSQIHTELNDVPKPKDGINGENATPQQISQAVDSYMAKNPVKNGQNGTNGQNVTEQQVQQAVDNYFANNPVKNGHDGTIGLDGKTPQIRCNTVRNRWEVRYSDTDNWQSLNGQDIKCTIDLQGGN